MSFILDALKKSDKQRSLGQPPGLDSPVEGGTGHGRGLIWATGLVLLGLVLVSTLAWREWSGHGLLGMAGIVDTPEVTAAGEDPSPGPDGAPLVESDPDPVEERGEPDAPDPAEPVVADVDEPTADRRRGRETEQADDAPAVQLPDTSRRRDHAAQREMTAEEARLAARREALERAELEAEREAEERRAELEAQEREQRRTRERLASIPDPGELEEEGTREPPESPGRRPAERPGEAAIGEPDAVEGTDDFQPDRRAYVERWELPPGVRRDLPELKLTMHVYSQDPDSRFVLVNSDRFREGEEVAPGVHLAEIRREGAILDYQQYRFLLTQ